MQTKTYEITDKRSWLTLRSADITSTEISSLFGCCPYLTSYELYWRKKSADIVELDPNERMAWGTRLERSIALGVAEDNGWVVEPMKEYARDEIERLGASFDFRIVADPTGEHSGPGMLEIKNVDGLIFRDGWIDNDTGLEAPPHIELQLQMQLMLTGYRWGVIAALIGGNRVELIRRLPDLGIHEAIRSEARKFWASIAANEPPLPDFARDAAVIARLYGFGDPGSVMDARENQRVTELCIAYRDAAEAEKLAAEQKDAAKAELLTIIGTAEKVIANGFTISAGTVGPAEISYTRKAYRNWRVTPKRAKA